MTFLYGAIVGFAAFPVLFFIVCEISLGLESRAVRRGLEEREKSIRVSDLHMAINELQLQFRKAKDNVDRLYKFKHSECDTINHILDRLRKLEDTTKAVNKKADSNSKKKEKVA